MVQYAKMLLAILPLAILVSCADESQQIDTHSDTPRKYALGDCLVRLDLNWDNSTDADAISKLKDKINEAAVSSMSADGMPRFGWHTPNNQSYYLFYFADRCGERRILMERLVTEYYEPNVNGFPEYMIVTDNIEPYFDGVKPSGWWTD